MTDYLLPETLPCPDCNQSNSIHIFLSSPPALGDPIRLGITKPDSAFVHGVLERMENSVPDGGVCKDSSGHIKFGQDGKPKKKYVNFSKARYSPGRTI
jgi:hypothetical protein